MHYTPTHRARQTLALLLSIGLIIQQAAPAAAQSFNAQDIEALRQNYSGMVGMEQQSAFDVPPLAATPPHPT
jgi:hypothetical protein